VPNGSFVNTVDNSYRKIKGVLSKAKGVVIPFFAKFEQKQLAGVPSQSRNVTRSGVSGKTQEEDAV